MKIVAGMTGGALAALLGLVPATALGQCCGDCNGDGQVTIDEILKGVNRALNGCVNDGICVTCTAQLTQCQADLASCESQPGGQRFPASGQTTTYGPGSDGAVRAGAALSYTDNGDGTITDNNTGLMWEKKDQSGGIHDWTARYTWGTMSPPYTMNGTMVTTFLATLNAGTGFAGHTDWRIPNVKELQSIVNYEIPYPGPAVDGAFSTGCTAACTVLTCSCTQSGSYWSSTTYQYVPYYAWVVDFYYGDVGLDFKGNYYYVRAVRGGL